ncbi:MAG TPA: hypothetical protein VMW70_17385 [Burkholderiales bacterium]|nr:hypothetical protein [Burkholderiales bacterium]
MPKLFPQIVTSTAARSLFGLWLAPLLLSGCTTFSLVTSEDLEADRLQRQALQTRQEELVDQIVNLTSVRGELETQLAAESGRREALEEQLDTADQQREALEERQEELEWYLQEQRSAAEGLKILTLQLEQWREQDLLRQSEFEQTQSDGDAELYLQLLEKRAQLGRLTAQLGEAILEVVRTKAKLRSLESKAEAASDLAEAEIAVESLKSRGEIWESDPGVIKAVELTELSAREFEQGNYGGALYLTGQAKNVIKVAEARSVNLETQSMVEGEKAFALPLPLRLLDDSDVRQGPAESFGVEFSLPAGMNLIGHSYKGQWVRVKTGEGLSGWVYYKNLVNPN